MGGRGGARVGWVAWVGRFPTGAVVMGLVGIGRVRAGMCVLGDRGWCVRAV